METVGTRQLSRYAEYPRAVIRRDSDGNHYTAYEEIGKGYYYLGECGGMLRGNLATLPLSAMLDCAVGRYRNRFEISATAR